MQLSDRLSGVLAAALGLGVVVYARTFPPMPGQNVGPSLFPTLIGAGLIGFGLWLVLADLRGARSGWVSFGAWARRPRMAGNAVLVVALLVFYIVAIEPVGFFLCSIVFLSALMAAFGGWHRWVLPTAVVVTLAIHYSFYSLLRVPLPWGVFEGLAW